MSDIPGNLEAIHHAGFTFANRDVEVLAATLQQLEEHPDEVAQAAKEVRTIVRTHFSWDRISEQTVEVYRTARH